MLIDIGIASSIQLARRTILKEANNSARVLLVALFLSLTTTLTTVLSIEIAREILIVVQRGRLPLDLFSVVGFFPADSPTQQLSWCTVFALTLPSLTWLGVYYRNCVFEIMALSAVRIVRRRLFSRILRASYQSTLVQQPGILAKRVVEDTAQLRALIVEVIFRRFADFITIVGVLIYLAVLNLTFALCTLAALLSYFLLAFWSATRAKLYMAERERSKDRLSAFTTEAVIRTLEIKSGSREDREDDKFRALAEDNESASLECARWITLDLAMTGFVRALGPVLILVLGSWNAVSSGTGIETLLAILAATSFLYGPVDSLSAVTVTLRQVEIAATNLNTLLDEPTEQDRWPGTGFVDPSLVGSPIISINNCTLSCGQNSQLLHIESIALPRGSLVAVVGLSGIGKTTFLRLLFGLFPLYEGSLQFAGRDIREISLSALRQHIAFLPQEAGVFAGTVRENIAYGASNPDAVSDVDVLVAMNAAGLSQDLSEAQLKLTTMLEFDGQNISVGQRKRIALARVLMQRPQAILLDEPATGVSPSHRRLIYETIERLTPATTVIVTTHDYEILNRAKMIVHLRRSERRAGAIIAEHGTHNELQRSSSYYRNLVAPSSTGNIGQMEAANVET